MTRRALLIGAETFGLEGVGRDVDAMDRALRARGFAVRRCEGPAATRDGIVTAYERLISDTRTEDAALVYYSGHGGYAWPLPGEQIEVARGNRQFIVPTDFAEPDGGDFLGITAVELSVLLARLTARTGNAVVVLDCCHSAMMSRDLGRARIRQLPRVVRLDLQQHVRRRLGAGLAVDLADPAGNPDAVRMVACGDLESAYELPDSAGPGGYGLFTHALIQALDEAAGTRATWARIVDRVRALIEPTRLPQRPEAEGPAERVLFETTSDDLAGSLPVTTGEDGTARIAGAVLAGVHAGDEFAVLDGAVQIATVRVAAVTLTTATGPLVPAVALPPDARAVRTRAVAPRIPVRVPAGLAGTVNGSGFARAAGPGEDPDLRVVTSADGLFTLHDRIGPLHAPRGPERLPADIDQAARALVLLGIRAESAWTIPPRITLQWGRVAGGEPVPLPVTGATVHVGDRVYLRIRNGLPREVYLSMLDVGVSYAVNRLTAFAPSGVRLPPGEEYVFGHNDWTDQLSGVELAWPAELDRGAPRPETVLAVITSEPQDLGFVQQAGVRGPGPEPSPVADLLAHFTEGATRDFRRPAQYCVPSFSFVLDPKPRG